MLFFRPFYAVPVESVADAGVQNLADVPQVRDLLRGGQTFLGGLVACVRGLRAAVDTGDINAPALLILHRTGAAAVGAVLQFDLVNRVHGIILSYRAKLTVCAEIT